MSRRPLSLQARSLLAAGIVLAAFLGLTGFALDQAIYETLRSALRDRLQSYVYGYLAASDVARSRRWLPPKWGRIRASIDPAAASMPASSVRSRSMAPRPSTGARLRRWVWRCRRWMRSFRPAP